MDQLRCYFCGRFLRHPYDSRVIFGGTGPEGLDPHDPDFFCKRCSTKLYKELLVKYKCCYREGDYEKSRAEIKAAKEAGLVWVHGTGFVEKSTGRDICYQYIREVDRNWRYVPYLEYHAKRREENRCKCYRVKNEDGTCKTCSRNEVFCLCRYDSTWGWF